MPGGEALRLHVVISGGASLGAYQAGALAGLLVALGALEEEAPGRVTLDAVGGASAGALVSLLAAATHVRGADPVRVLREAWVERVSVELLLGGDRSPLDLEVLREPLRALLATGPFDRPRPRRPVALHLALTGLRGLTYHVAGVRGPRSVPAVTYADWDGLALEPGFDLDELFEPAGAAPVDVALASAANPGVFAPRLLDRSPAREHYERHGIEDLPDHGRLWFTDGGVVQSEPVGRLLATARRTHGPPDGRPLVLLVDPRSEGPSSGERWSDPDARPGWLDGLSRTLSILPAQILYEDLRKLGRDNARLELCEELADRLAPHLDPAAADELGRFVAEHAHGSDAEPDDALDLLRLAIRTAAGMEEKTRTDVDVLSPLLLLEERPDPATVPALLAGERLGDFAGFLDRDLRRSDFVLGYATTRAWLRPGLEGAGLDPRLAGAAVAALEDAADHDWERVNRGAAAAADLPGAARWSMVKLLARAFWVAAGEALAAADLPRPLHAVVDRGREAVRWRHR